MARPLSIKVIGLRAHLDATTGIHKGKGYISFRTMIADGASVSFMARAFGVNRITVNRWLEIYREELKAERIKKGKI